MEVRTQNINQLLGIEAPWAAPSVRCTTPFEAHAIGLLEEKSVAAAAKTIRKHLGESLMLSF